MYFLGWQGIVTLVAILVLIVFLLWSFAKHTK